MTTLTLRIPDNLRNELMDISRQEHRAASEVVRESIQRYVAVQKFRMLRNKTLPFAEAQGILTDDDVFKALK